MVCLGYFDVPHSTVILTLLEEQGKNLSVHIAIVRWSKRFFTFTLFRFRMTGLFKYYRVFSGIT